MTPPTVLYDAGLGALDKHRRPWQECHAVMHFGDGSRRISSATARESFPRSSCKTREDLSTVSPARDVNASHARRNRRPRHLRLPKYPVGILCQLRHDLRPLL